MGGEASVVDILLIGHVAAPLVGMTETQVLRYLYVLVFACPGNDSALDEVMIATLRTAQARQSPLSAS